MSTELDGAGAPDAVAVSEFSTLGLRSEVLQSIVKAGYSTPSDIQRETIPQVLAGRDVVAQAVTGSGKTAAFACPLLSRIDLARRAPQVLVLAPTRELAMQVTAAIDSYAANLDGFRSVTLYGGQPYEQQLRALSRGVQFVVGTPGRVMDHVRRGTLALDGLSAVVLDEADEMLRMGFIDDVEWLLEKMPAERQVLLFSATMPAPIRRIAANHLREPAEVSIRSKGATSDTIRQRYLVANAREKADLLARLLETESPTATIVFTATKARTLELAERLVSEGHSAAALNGDMPQPMRERTIDQLRKGRLNVLVATDVAARGLDVERVSHVINFDFPHDLESYVHRIGRTGRAGRAGDAILFCGPRDQRKLNMLGNATKQGLEQMPVPTGAAVTAARVTKFKEQIVAAAQAKDLNVYAEVIEELREESGLEVTVIAAALARMARGGMKLRVADLGPPPRERSERFDSRDRGHSNDRPRRDRSNGAPVGAQSGFRTYRVEAGASHGIGPKNLVGAIANETGLPNAKIGRIRVSDSHSLIELPENLDGDFFNALRGTWVGGQKLKLRPWEATDSGDERPPRRGADHRGKPAQKWQNRGGPNAAASKSAQKRKTTPYAQSKVS